MNIYKSVTELIGKTPLVELSGFSQKHGLSSPIVGKVEFFNPTSSVKDRAALYMVNAAEKSGLLAPSGTIIEPTSGNTGVALAAIAAARGYRLILTMPESMSIERRKLHAAFGAEIVLTPAAEGMQGAVDRANTLAAEIPGSIITGQFYNPANPTAHLEMTGPEIWADTDGQVAVLVAGVGTGGTLSGTAAYLKKQNSSIYAAAVEPASSPLLSEGKAGPHELQGLGANFEPANFNRSMADEIITVTADDAMEAARDLARLDGLLVGISAGAAAFAAVQLSLQPKWQDKMIVAVLPDTGERYLSTRLFQMQE